tara:strand:- start:372 stop:809 length:438 start_codon:yes stop_codon:yes gene_type:complete
LDQYNNGLNPLFLEYANEKRLHQFSIKDANEIKRHVERSFSPYLTQYSESRQIVSQFKNHALRQRKLENSAGLRPWEVDYPWPYDYMINENVSSSILTPDLFNVVTELAFCLNIQTPIKKIFSMMFSTTGPRPDKDCFSLKDLSD